MSSNFEGTQFERCFNPKCLGQWEVPSSQPRRPQMQPIPTTFQAHDNGHLFSEIPRNSKTTWGSYVGTWRDFAKTPGVATPLWHSKVKTCNESSAIKESKAAKGKQDSKQHAGGSRQAEEEENYVMFDYLCKCCPAGLGVANCPCWCHFAERERQMDLARLYGYPHRGFHYHDCGFVFREDIEKRRAEIEKIREFNHQYKKQLKIAKQLSPRNVCATAPREGEGGSPSPRSGKEGSPRSGRKTGSPPSSRKAHKGKCEDGDHC